MGRQSQQTSMSVDGGGGVPGCCYGTSLGKKRCLLCPCPHSLFAQLSNGDVFMFWKDSVSSCGPAFLSLSPLFSCYALTTSRLSVSAPLLLGSVTVLPGGIVLPLLASATLADNLDKHTDINATADQKFGFPDVLVNCMRSCRTTV